MTQRVPKFSPTFRASLEKAKIAAGSLERTAIGRLIGALATAPELPGEDEVVPIPLTTYGYAHARRLPGRHVWVYYRLYHHDGAEHLVLIAVTRKTPKSI